MRNIRKSYWKNLIYTKDYLRKDDKLIFEPIVFPFKVIKSLL